MGASCSRGTPADVASQEKQGARGPASADEPVKPSKKGQVVPSDGLTAVEKSLIKREKSLHMDAAEKRSQLSMNLASQGRTFQRNTTLQISKMLPQEALDELIKGNARFILGETENPHQDFKRLAEIAPHQTPFAAVLACSDSRAPVEIVFDQGFGDIFCCRVAGNIAAAEQVASLEYAVLELGVKVIMVMGHTACGAVKAACSGKAFPGFIDILVNDLDVALARAQTYNTKTYEDFTDRVQAFKQESQGASHGGDLIERVIRENVMYQLDRCRRSTIILEAVNRGSLMLVPALYDIETGEVEVLH